MESGLVVLAPSKSGEKHSTKQYEEVLVVFSGTGEMRITGSVALNLKPNIVAYCPPKTEHHIVNTGSEPLRYLYVAAKAQP
jgi:mannose-6-phosphate isomerase-like protein (cupin superfamily)